MKEGSAYLPVDFFAVNFVRAITQEPWFFVKPLAVSDRFKAGAVITKNGRSGRSGKY